MAVWLEEGQVFLIHVVEGCRVFRQLIKVHHPAHIEICKRGVSESIGPVLHTYMERQEASSSDMRHFVNKVANK